MNPIYIAAIAAAQGKRLRCSVCGKEQIVSSQARSGRQYRCKRCRHLFAARELQPPPSDRG